MKQQSKVMMSKKVKQDFIISHSQSIEPYYKRTLQKLGWLEFGHISTPGSNGINYHIRFDITDKEGSHNHLKPN